MLNHPTAIAGVKTNLFSSQCVGTRVVYFDVLINRLSSVVCVATDVIIAYSSAQSVHYHYRISINRGSVFVTEQLLLCV